MIDKDLLRYVKAGAEAADEKQGDNIVALDVHEITSLTDAFLFVGGTSHVHVKTLEDAIRTRLRAEGAELRRTDGRRGYPWRVLDYGNLIVHVIEKATRDFYSIERLWIHGKPISLTSKPAEKKPRTARKKTVKKAVKKAIKKAVKKAKKKTAPKKKPLKKKK